MTLSMTAKLGLAPGSTLTLMPGPNDRPPPGGTTYPAICSPLFGWADAHGLSRRSMDRQRGGVTWAARQRGPPLAVVVDKRSRPWPGGCPDRRGRSEGGPGAAQAAASSLLGVTVAIVASSAARRAGRCR